MSIHPYISSQVAADRQRELLAKAERHRLAAQFRSRPRAARHGAWASRGLRRALATVAVRRTELPA
jgi:pyridoxine/pyridoxamine 5'-phosphate oxidase